MVLIEKDEQDAKLHGYFRIMLCLGAITFLAVLGLILLYEELFLQYIAVSFAALLTIISIFIAVKIYRLLKDDSGH